MTQSGVIHLTWQGKRFKSERGLLLGGGGSRNSTHLTNSLPFLPSSPPLSTLALSQGETVLMYRRCRHHWEGQFMESFAHSVRARGPGERRDRGRDIVMERGFTCSLPRFCRRSPLLYHPPAPAVLHSLAVPFENKGAIFQLKKSANM
jgi:hypothetical protein